MDEFIKSSLATDLFQVEDVENDNACFYRSLSNGLGFVSKDPSKMVNLEEDRFGHYRNFTEFYNSELWGYNGENQEILARELQDAAVNWVKERREERAPLPEEGPNLTFEELVMMVHEISFSEYLENYSYFAGDVVLEKNDDSEQISLLDDRWGGYVEQLALSEYLKLPIVVLTAQKYDTRLDKIITGRIYRNKAIKGVRFKVYQTSGLEYLTRGGPILYLLWKKTKNGDHYMTLYPKDPISCLDAVKNN